MLELRFARRWKIAGGLLLLLVLLGAIMPVVWMWPDRVSVRAWISHIDKWAHGLTFAFLALWFAGQYAKRSYWRIALGLFVFGLFIEAFQRLLGYRTADFYDVLANSLGIASGLLLALVWLGGWSLTVERWLSRDQ